MTRLNGFALMYMRQRRTLAVEEVTCSAGSDFLRSWTFCVCFSPDAPSHVIMSDGRIHGKGQADVLFIALLHVYAGCRASSWVIAFQCKHGKMHIVPWSVG